MSTDFIEQKARFKLHNSSTIGGVVVAGKAGGFDILRAELNLLASLGIVEWDTNTGQWVTDLTTPQVNAILFELRNK